ncbi:MAG TPA: bifunctional nuclease family protein [Thermoanaerobaculia bacterium]|nr:bifunctional nuclease family protein [Thermoanaerobaculia bacterium]
MPESTKVQMIIRGLMIDPSSNSPIVVLRVQERDIFLPIWIGVSEASAIQMTLEGMTPPRPMTHDLLVQTLSSLEAELQSVVIRDLEDNVFFATLNVEQAGKLVEIDARPSDALALALRVGAEVFVEQHVLEKAQAIDISSLDVESGEEGDEEDRLKKWFEGLSPEDLGKYTM